MRFLCIALLCCWGSLGAIEPTSSLEDLLAKVEREFEEEIERGLKNIESKVELSVYQALKQAWAFNLDLRRQQSQTQSAEDNRRAFYLQFIPNVTLSASIGQSTSITPYIKQDGSETRSDEWSTAVPYSVGLNASVTLFDMPLLTKLSRLSADYQQALITEEVLRKSIAINVIKKAYAVLKAERQLDVSELDRRIKERYLQFALADYREGRKSRLDYLVAKSEFQSSEVDFWEKQSRAESARRTLNLLLGYVPEQQLELKSQLDRDIDLDKALPAFDPQMPELRQKQLELSNTERQLRESYLALLPQFSLTGSLRFDPISSSLYRSDGDITTTLGSSSLSASFQLTWDLSNFLPFSSGNRNIREKRDNLQHAQDTYSATLRQKRLEYIDHLQQLVRAKKSLQSYKASLAVAKERLNEAEFSYDQGLVSYDHLLAARKELENLENSTDDLVFSIMEILLQLGGQLNLQYF